MTRGMPDKVAVVGVEPRGHTGTDTDDAAGAELDRRIVLATQGGLPLVARPYAAVHLFPKEREYFVEMRLEA